jgi:peptidoglycan/xylan/chitin deacetylase (PgdA/CDA1 family)
MDFKNKILLVLAIFVLSASFVFADVITKLNTDKKQVAITFDACETYSPAYFDMKILDYLVSEQIPVTLFLSGKFIKRNLEKVKELSAIGFIEIENHSLKHRHMKSVSRDVVVEEIIKNEALIAETTGTIPRFFRFPFGEYDKESLDAVESLGYKVVHWSFESGDPDPARTTKNLIIKTIAKTKPGSILIFHINSRGWRTKDALPVIVEQLKLEGYEFVLLRDVISSSRKLHLDYDDLL